MDENSSSFVQLHRDDSGYGSPLLNHEFLSPQQSYYSYQHTYHTHNMNYSNNSFHMYDQFIGNNNNNNNNNTYNTIDTSITLPIEQPSSSAAMNLCSSPIKDSINSNNCPPYEYKINWGKELIMQKIENFCLIVLPQGRRRRQRTVFTQNNVQQLDSVFMHNQYPDIELRETLAAQMGVPESRIQVWFKNRRTRARTAHRQHLKQSESSSSSH